MAVRLSPNLVSISRILNETMDFMNIRKIVIFVHFFEIIEHKLYTGASQKIRILWKVFDI